ncbi:MAG: energy-coupled thiamine transporter ThiT [Faecalibacterium sp.]
MSKTYSKTRILVEGALMIALATILSELKIFSMPYGGDITLCAMLPILLMSFRHELKWGVFTAFVYSLLQLVLGLNNLAYCATLFSQIGCVLLDYLCAFTVLGTACFFAKPFKNKLVSVAFGSVIACALRLVFAVMSGALLWGSYQSYYEWAAGLNVWVYSLIYNLNYLLPETILTAIAVVLIAKFAPKLFDAQ